MKAHELFGVALRVIGVWEVVYGLVQFPTWMSTFGQFVYVPSPVAAQAIMRVGILSGVHVVVGIALFFAANWIVRLAYAPTEPGPPDDDLQPLAKMPPHVKLPLLIMGAIAATTANIWTARSSAMQVSANQPSTLHAVVLLAMGCAALAFLFRKRWPPLEFFFRAWIAAVSLSIAINSGRFQY